MKTSHLDEFDFKGLCPICSRGMYADGQSLDKHHFVPKSKGGKETELVHVVCHRKIHSLFTEAECASTYNDPELVKTHPEMQKFIAWIQKKDPLYNDHSRAHHARGHRKK